MEATSRETAPLAPALLVRRVLVALIMVFYIGTTLPDIALPWHPMGSFGFGLDPSGNVYEVAPHSPAARAGIRVGDRNDFAATPVDARRYQYAGLPDTAASGARAVYAFDRGAKHLTISLVAVANRPSLADDVSGILLVMSQVVPSLIGAWLLLQRPSRMTWAFFLFTTGTPLLCSTVVSYLPTNAIIGLYVFEAPIAFQSLWLFIFALRFPNDAATGWRRFAERAILIALVPLIPLNLWNLDGALVGLPPHPAIIAFFAGLNIWGLVAATATFLLTYFQTTKSNRARIRWVMLGLVGGYSGQIGFNFLLTFPTIFSVPSWGYGLIASTQIFVAIAVAYAVVRHRVFDVRFFIGRAIVYGTLTSIVVSLLSLVDLLAGKLLSGTGLVAIGEAGLAVVVGLGLDGVHKHVEARRFALVSKPARGAGATAPRRTRLAQRLNVRSGGKRSRERTRSRVPPDVRRVVPPRRIGNVRPRGFHWVGKRVVENDRCGSRPRTATARGERSGRDPSAFVSRGCVASGRSPAVDRHSDRRSL